MNSEEKDSGDSRTPYILNLGLAQDSSATRQQISPARLTVDTIQCKAAVSYSILLCWVAVGLAVAAFVYLSATADRAFMQREVADCFVESDSNANGSLSMWKYEFAHKVFSHLRAGADTSRSPQDCYVLTSNPADVEFDWDIPQKRRTYAHGLEISAPFFLLLTAAISIMKAPIAQCKACCAPVYTFFCRGPRRATRFHAMSIALDVRSASETSV